MPILVLLLLAMVVEITALVLVGGLVGLLPTILLLVAATFLGVALLRREGTRALSALQRAIAARRPPGPEILDGALIAAAGVLVVVPGFVSDALAVLLLLPPTRALVRRALLRRARARTGPIVVEAEVVDPLWPVDPQWPGDGPTIVIPERREP